MELPEEESAQTNEVLAQKADKVQKDDELIAAGTTGEISRHPSRSLESRAKGFGIAAGYERSYKQRKAKAGDRRKEIYGPLPHAGYYGVGVGGRPFQKGQASFSDELTWYQAQYGESTSGFGKRGKE